jgi:hypothetical protein
MEMEEFLKKLEECSHSWIESGHYILTSQGYKLNENRIIEIIEKKKDKICSKCGTDLSSSPIGIRVIVDETQKPFTIFEASLLFMMYIHNKIPYDYANFHKCIAGKEFIKNIKQVERI